MTLRPVRVRFAPSPTGMMHLGSVRTALLNYLFARRKGGTFVLRIEDTDAQRNFDPGAQQIIKDLQWLGLDYDEGPIKGGPYGPYFQSERDHLYQQELDRLKERNMVYHCFCSPQELERKRIRQLALKMPPRYDRACLNISAQEIELNLTNKIPFIWRVKLNPDEQLTISDMAHGEIVFDMKNFSDFPITRADGTVTFMFANFVDDMLMEISHVIRGEDHLTNTAGQVALYRIFQAPMPVFWHVPILCNAQGKKLSKRDFGFSLIDLRNAGYLPQALNNYLSIIGVAGVEQEIMDLSELARFFEFDKLHAAGHIKYDVEKLRWVNHKWINRIDENHLLEIALPFIAAVYPSASDFDQALLLRAVRILKTDMYTLAQAPEVVGFLFNTPQLTRLDFEQVINADALEPLAELIKTHLPIIEHPHQFVDAVKAGAKAQAIAMNQLFCFMRLALTGKSHGPALIELIEILGPIQARQRLETIVAAW